MIEEITTRSYAFWSANAHRVVALAHDSSHVVVSVNGEECFLTADDCKAMKEVIDKALADLKAKEAGDA